MMILKFMDSAENNLTVKKEVLKFFADVSTLEDKLGLPAIIFQDGKSKGYYIKVHLFAKHLSNLLDFKAKLNDSAATFKANRDLLEDHNTFKRMKIDSEEGREFNDIIVEFTQSYNPDRPLKIWGGQHRSKAIVDSLNHENENRCHGFKVYFCLTPKQRNEIALISNTNINVTNDLFDRIQEETLIGDKLRKWAQMVGFLDHDKDFPDKKSKAEVMTVKLARSFVVNFYLGKEKSKVIPVMEIDQNIYEPHLCDTGINIDSVYESIIDKYDVWNDEDLLEAGRMFVKLHEAQKKAVQNSKKIINRQQYINKALVESVITSWSYVAGLLQQSTARLKRHYKVPETNSKIPDPLNAVEMSNYKHETDPTTYRGLGTRSAVKDRQRVTQLFLARTVAEKDIIDKKLIRSAVRTATGLQYLENGYTSS